MSEATAAGGPFVSAKVGKELWVDLVMASIHSHLTEIDKSKPWKDRLLTPVVEQADKDSLDPAAAVLRASKHRATMRELKEYIRTRICINPDGCGLLDAAFSACRIESKALFREYGEAVYPPVDSCAGVPCAWTSCTPADVQIQVFGNKLGEEAVRTEQVFEIRNEWLRFTSCLSVIGNAEAWMRERVCATQLRGHNTSASFKKRLVLSEQQWDDRHTFNDALRYVWWIVKKEEQASATVANNQEEMKE